MANNPETRHPIEKLADDIEFKQHNTTWPDVMVNASNADELMWKGARRITRVQRIGIAVFGLLFVLSGISLLSVFPLESWWIEIPIATGFVLVGCKLLWNSVRKNDPPTEGAEDE
jgi:hypothetical protein